MNRITSPQAIKAVLEVRREHGTPFYFYDTRILHERCEEMLAMPSAYGLTVRYAMKANSNRSILKLIHSYGIKMDASSVNEALRAVMAGVPASDIMLTSQELPVGENLTNLKNLMKNGMKYNVCSLRQLYNIGDFVSEQGFSLSVRMHPGTGSGESATRNTGDKYSCFGVHLSDVDDLNRYAKGKGIAFTEVHVHIGSGGDPAAWKENIDREIDIIDTYFPDATSVSFGGGLKVARMPDEIGAEVRALGDYAARALIAFHDRTGRKLRMEVEPGTYIVAQCGYAVTTCMDTKQTGEDGLNFLITDGGLEINSRPLMYGSRHPFYVFGSDGVLISSEETVSDEFCAAVVGKCCESGDCQTLDSEGRSEARPIGRAEAGDVVCIGGVGAYCSSMTPFNYNSHTQVPEFLYDGTKTKMVRKRQTLEQIVENEI